VRCTVYCSVCTDPTLHLDLESLSIATDAVGMDGTQLHTTQLQTRFSDA